MVDEDVKLIDWSIKLNKPGIYIFTVRSKNTKVLH